jgi:hypothetical protein
LNGADTVETFQTRWVDFLLSSSGKAAISVIPDEAGERIQELVKEQFSKWEWNVARTPPFQYRLAIGDGHLVLEINKGIIQNCVTDLVSDQTSIDVEALIGEPFREETFIKNLIALARISVASFYNNTIDDQNFHP